MFLVFFVSCSRGDTQYHENDRLMLCVPENILISDSALGLCEEYMDYLDNEIHVYQVFLEQNPDSTTILIRFQRFAEYLYLDKVSGYFKLRDNLFLLYLGQYSITESQKEFIKKIETELRKYRIYNLDSAPPFSFDYGFLEIKISQETRQITKRYVPQSRYGFQLPPPPPVE
jgi:hypothetical protein